MYYIVILLFLILLLINIICKKQKTKEHFFDSNLEIADDTMDKIDESTLELKTSKNEIEEKIRKSSSTFSFEEYINKQKELNNSKIEVIELINLIKQKQQLLKLDVEDINMVELQEVEGSQNLKNLINELSRELENGKSIKVVIDNNIAILQQKYKECRNKKIAYQNDKADYTKKKNEMNSRRGQVGPWESCKYKEDCKDMYGYEGEGKIHCRKGDGRCMSDEACAAAEVIDKVKRGCNRMLNFDAENPNPESDTEVANFFKNIDTDIKKILDDVNIKIGNFNITYIESLQQQIKDSESNLLSNTEILNDNIIKLNAQKTELLAKKKSLEDIQNAKQNTQQIINNTEKILTMYNIDKKGKSQEEIQLVLDKYELFIEDMYEIHFIFNELQKYEEIKKTFDFARLEILKEEMSTAINDINRILNEIKQLLNEHNENPEEKIDMDTVRSKDSAIQQIINNTLIPSYNELTKLYNKVGNLQKFEKEIVKIGECLKKVKSLSENRISGYKDLERLKNENNIECFANMSDGYIPYTEETRLASSGTISIDSQQNRKKWWNNYKGLTDKKNCQQTITRQKIIQMAENKLGEKNLKKNNQYLKEISECQPNFYKENIKIGAKKEQDGKFTNFKLFNNSIGKDLLSKENTINKDELNYEIMKKPQLSGKFKFNGNTKNVSNLEFTTNHKNKFTDLQKINNLDDYHNYQLSKKNNIDIKTDYKNKKQIDLRFNNIDNINSDKNNNVIHDSLLEGETFNDLFGEPHDIQHTTFSTLVSRGFPMAKDKKNIGYEHNDATEEQKKGQTAVICKSCPVPLTQTYQFLNEDDPNFKDDLKKLNIIEDDSDLTSENGRYKNFYFHEIGGAYQDFEKVGNTYKRGNCNVCDYPAGCYNPNELRRDLYEIQSCKQGKNRVCSKCGTCYKGEERVLSFCGEGHNADTQCTKCTPCEKDTYKVYGCDKDNTPYDNVCIDMTTCKGKPENDEYKDPGEGKRYYMLKDGIRGGNDYQEKYKDGDKEKKLDKFKFYKLDNDLVRERKEIVLTKMIKPIDENNKKNNIFGMNRNSTDKLKYIDLNNGNLYKQHTPDISKNDKKTLIQKNNYTEERDKRNSPYPKKKIYNTSKYFILTFVISIEKIPNSNSKQEIFNLSGNNMPKFYINYENSQDKKVKIIAEVNGEIVEPSNFIFIEELDLTNEPKNITDKRNLSETNKLYSTKIIHVTFLSYLGSDASKNSFYIFNHDNRLDLENITKNKKVIQYQTKQRTSEVSIISKDSHPFGSKLFDICYYNLNDNPNMENIDIKYFHYYFKSNKLPIHIDSVRRYLVYETNEEILKRQNNEMSDEELNVDDKDFIPNKMNNPFYGKDRVCGKCDTCPPGFIDIFGCTGKNNKFNTICQRVIKVNDYLYKDVTHLIPEGNYYSKFKLKNEIIKKNIILGCQDDIIREEKFGIKITRFDNFGEIFKANKDLENETQKEKLYEEMNKYIEKYKDSHKDSNGEFIFKIKTVENLNETSEGFTGKIYEESKNINNPKFYDPIPILTDEEIAELGTIKCSVNKIDQLDRNPLYSKEKETKMIELGDVTLTQKSKLIESGEDYPEYYINPNNPGCKGESDTNFIPHSKCREDGTEKMVSRGTVLEDTKCGECKCPLGTVGLRPECTGTFDDLVTPLKGCKEEKKCLLTPSTSDTPSQKQIYYDRPGEYKDYTRDNDCMTCQEKCPPGTFKLRDCKPGTSNDTMCKPHRECDPETMIIANTGTDLKDTVCQCIDGYDWPSDEITGEKDLTAPKCVKIEGKCHTNPCHPNANCYDNFDEGTGKFLNYVCRCDNSEGWVETEMVGRGPKGCIKLPTEHNHDIEEKEVPKELKEDYPELDPKLFKVKGHLESDYHRNRSGTGRHIHKTYY